MAEVDVSQLSGRYTATSDRFRSLWTFYQFLGGVFKHQNLGPVPFSFDFHALSKRVQDLVPHLALPDPSHAARELEHIERELARIHGELARIEADFPPSLLRRFFDHLKRQDQKILFALVKFYLQGDDLDGDTLDKLDILLTRLSELPLENGRVVSRSRPELLSGFERLAELSGHEPPTPAEEGALREELVGFRKELEQISSFGELLSSQVYDRYRSFKQGLGAALLQPTVLVEVVATNIDAKNRFRELYQDEEVRILEDTNRIFEIERYLERNPDLAHSELRRQIEAFRRFRIRFDSGRKEDNVKREDILDLRQAMNRVLESFEPGAVASVPTGLTQTSAGEIPVDEVLQFGGQEEPALGRRSADGEPSVFPEEEPRGESFADLLPADPLLNETLHKVMFALELVVWDHAPEQAAFAKELHHLHLEPWEVGAYRRLVEHQVSEGTMSWELERFFITSAALRVKMEEEAEEVSRLARTPSADRLYEVLERSAQSLERARELDRRFHWFIEDMLYRGDTVHLEQVYRSHFRFLRAFSQLWLDHQENGGITPL
jgi:hypothetical protein